MSGNSSIYCTVFKKIGEETGSSLQEIVRVRLRKFSAVWNQKLPIFSVRTFCVVELSEFKLDNQWLYPCMPGNLGRGVSVV